MNSITHRLILAAGLFALPGLALAHAGAATSAGFAAAFMHPISGLDHVAAMLAIGLWAGLGTTRRGAAIILGCLFALFAGAWLGRLGLELPGIEAGIAASVLILGLLLMLSLRFSASAALAWAGLFALFHGQAHGLEMSWALGAPPGALGFVSATTLILLLGLGLGRAAQAAHALWVARLAGTLCAGLGAGLLLAA